MSAGLVVAADRERELALARQAVAGDERAFARLYDEHAGRVFALCLRMSGSRELAGELTQDVFVHVWERLASWRGESALSSWIYRLTVNLVLSNVRADTRRRKHEMTDADLVDDDDEPMTNPAPGASADSRIHDAMDLEAAIASLPPGARAVFVLHDVEGYQHGDIAAMTGTAEGTCRAQLHRARKLLIEALNR